MSLAADSCLANEQIPSYYETGNFIAVYNNKRRLSCSPCNETPRHEDVWRNEGIATRIRTSALHGYEWWASRFGCFILRKEPPIGWVRCQFGRGGKRKIPGPTGKSNPGLPAHSYSLHYLSYPEYWRGSSLLLPQKQCMTLFCISFPFLTVTSQCDKEMCSHLPVKR
jgi:hypothetical protein